ncbi:MAG TPA: CbtA family protein, partial [Bauldia sp.]|nr:CbtA family protein [Bauldia sp.]
AGPAWSPADGAERVAFTALANLVVGVGVSLVLLALMVLKGSAIDARRGLVWGAAAFVAVALLPSLGLPPELPGTPAGDLLSRQLWWVGTAVASGLGIALIAFGAHWAVKVAGVVLLVLPHAVGAPAPPSHDVAYPGALAGEFVVASLVVSAVLWSLSGAAAGWLYQRLSRAA